MIKKASKSGTPEGMAENFKKVSEQTASKSLSRRSLQIIVSECTIASQNQGKYIWQH